MNADPLDLTGRTIMITGGAGALGLAITARLREHGARVAVVDVAEEAAVRRALGDPQEGFAYVHADLTSAEEATRAVAAATEALGPPDTVCCHAGIARSGALPDFSVADFDAVHELNVRSGFVVASEAARRWIADGTPGHLVFTSSWVQDVPWPGITPYAAGKAAVRALARGFARELAPHGIRANIVAPGIVDAGMARHQWETEPDYRRRASRAVPLGYLQPLESVADTFLFLCSPLASYMTGSTLLVDGGAGLYPMDGES
ncbi:SDR family NAD(P)-dependent oxidoreductase [Nocardiopsis xinjiangensis]|uniref:SDR family NAD(P)-dependent oxidoreductase n=1 Tax=Nocardiopsis xinjiangensis TaxID=124285 RepID=UPI0003475494|nr:SDR family NAD(P)-dependent oxidoreductase [Nocardiopsis xinjiangensis]